MSPLFSALACRASLSLQWSMPMVRACGKQQLLPRFLCGMVCTASTSRLAPQFSLVEDKKGNPQRQRQNEWLFYAGLGDEQVHTRVGAHWTCKLGAHFELCGTERSMRP
eukprot:1161215-Pelagomonas_calceolata.AAC.16